MTNQEKLIAILAKKTKTDIELVKSLVSWDMVKQDIFRTAASEGWETGSHMVEIGSYQTQSGHVETYDVYYINEPINFDEEGEAVDWFQDVNII